MEVPQQILDRPAIHGARPPGNIAKIFFL